MKRRLWLLLLAAVVIVALLLYPSSQCHVSSTDLAFSPLKTFVVPVEQGYAVGFSFNVTNQGGCEINARNMHVVLRSVTFTGGNGTPQTSDETDPVSSVVPPGGTALFSYTFTSYFTYRPTKLNLRVEMSFAGAEPALVFDGELAVLG
jgi:hypothetical protein